MTQEFLNVHVGGVDFGKGIVKIHPQLKSVISLKNVAQRKKIIRIYFDNYYQTHRTEMLRKLKRVQNKWCKREKKYIVITENYFGGFKFPEGKYIAYASIINCNPRFLDSKTFQFFYKKSINDAIYTITHELLHFIFFDFIKQKLRKETKQLSEDQLWTLSEIFNVVVLKSPRYRNIIDQKLVIPYPNHKQYVKQFQKVYKNSRNAEEFVRKGIDIIKAKKITGE
jgi:hypothetical protein